MGGSRWSDDFYNAREADRAATGKSAFSYSATATRVHDKLNTLGVKLRESRDSAAHPNSKSIAVLFDVTGSMGSIPVTLQKKLAELMGLLIRKGYVDHPQILFGAVGDATCDRAPLQIGQFESGIEMDDDLSRFYLEGGGGGQKTESYELAAYFIARHTAIDCFEKRGEKGYLFIIGDEAYYPKVSAKQVNAIIGDKLQTDIPTREIFDELRKRFEVFFLIPRGASNAGDNQIRAAWQKLLGQNVLSLDDPAAVCEAIALSIGMCEGKIDLADGLHDLRDYGTASTVINTISTALAPLARATANRKTAAITGHLPALGPGGSLNRL
ncbi:MAG TPA: hypothetical protein VHM90_22940 [Phycisphaerae bacterium]|nr:hypothetical protein [Phycisphaerae bacterium]